MPEQMGKSDSAPLMTDQNDLLLSRTGQAEIPIMSTSFTIDFAGDYINVQLPANYELTPASRLAFWTAIGEAYKKYHCCRVLAESPTPPIRDLKQSDSLKSAFQAAKVSSELRVAFVFPGYSTDATTEFFINTAYKMGVRIEFFTDRESAIKWLCIVEETQ
jgi:hypothetical protein